MKFYVNFKRFHGFNPNPPVRVDIDETTNNCLVYSVGPGYLMTNEMTRDELERDHCEIDERIVDKRLVKALTTWNVDRDQDWFKNGLYFPPDNVYSKNVCDDLQLEG